MYVCSTCMYVCIHVHTMYVLPIGTCTSTCTCMYITYMYVMYTYICHVCCMYMYVLYAYVCTSTYMYVHVILHNIYYIHVHVHVCTCILYDVDYHDVLIEAEVLNSRKFKQKKKRT